MGTAEGWLHDERCGTLSLLFDSINITHYPEILADLREDHREALMREFVTDGDHCGDRQLLARAKAAFRSRLNAYSTAVERIIPTLTGDHRQKTVQAIRTLPERDSEELAQRETALLLYHGFGRDLTYIAGVLRTSVSAVRQTLHAMEMELEEGVREQLPRWGKPRDIGTEESRLDNVSESDVDKRKNRSNLTSKERTRASFPRKKAA